MPAAPGSPVGAMSEEQRALLDQLNPIWLTFKESHLEAAYCEWAFDRSGFNNGKLWFAMTIILWLITTVGYHWYRWSWGMFTSSMWIPITISGLATAALVPFLFIRPLFKYREKIYLVGLLLHWPAFTIAIVYGVGEPFEAEEARYRYTYSYLQGCLFFCTFLAQARFFISLFFLSASPLLTLIITTLWFPVNYWQDRNVAEVVFWLLLFLPIFMLRVFEKITRLSFLQVHRSEAALSSMTENVALARKAVTSYFPMTAVKDLLVVDREAGVGPRRAQPYPATALVKVSLVGSFRTTDRSDLFRILMQFYRTVDEEAERCGVDRISTLGDSYVGAVLPTPQMMAPGLRCHRAIAFALSFMRSWKDQPMSDGCQIKGAAIVADVVGGFVGISPPKFDVFGAGVDELDSLEAHMQPGQIGITPHFQLELKKREMEPFEEASGTLFYDLRSSIPPVPMRRQESDRRSNSVQSGFSANSAPTSIQSAESDQVSRPLRLGEGSERSPSAGSGGGSSSVREGEERINPDAIGAALYEISIGSAGERAQGLSALGALVIGNEAEVEKQLTAEQLEQAVDFSIFTLSFQDPKLEKAFSKYVQATGVLRNVFTNVAVFWIGVLACEMLTSCVSALQDRLLLGSRILIVSIYSLALFVVGTSWNLWYIFMHIVGYYMFVTAGFYSEECAGDSTNNYYAANVFALYAAMATIHTQFHTTVRFPRRCVMTVASMLVFYAVIGIRQFAMKSTGLTLDPLGLIGLGAYFAANYFVDFSLRSSFSAVARLKNALKGVYGEYNKTAAGVVDLLLPNFAWKKLIKEDDEKSVSASRSSGSIAPSQKSSSKTSNRSLRGSLNGRSDERENSVELNLVQAWSDETNYTATNYTSINPHHFGDSNSTQHWSSKDATVLHLFLSPNMDGEDPSGRRLVDLQHEIFSAVESEVFNNQGNRIHKVKTYGSHMILICGIQDEISVGSSTKVMVSLARTIAKMAVDQGRASYKMSIATGPCHFLILSVSKLYFDVFGEAVNTAKSLIEATAMGSIHVTNTVHDIDPMPGAFLQPTSSLNPRDRTWMAVI